MDTETVEKDLLAILLENPKASVGEIADEAGVSRPTAQKYIQKLEDEGAIVGYSVELNPKKLEHLNVAFVGIDVASERYVEVKDELRDITALTALYTATGDHMLMAEVLTHDDEEIHDVISEEILDIDGVTAACPTVLHERIT